VIVDASAVIAVLRAEPDAATFAEALAADEPKRMSVVSWLEAAIVIDGSRDPVASARFDTFCRRAGIERVEVTAAQADLARQAYRDYGRGSGHPAALNFGDCFAYALARERGEPLLFKGEYFALTDIEAYPIQPR
jgi:ribonuclease VapC